MDEERTLDMFEDNDLEELSEFALNGNAQEFNRSFGELLEKYSKKKIKENEF